MTLADILASLFPGGHAVSASGGLVRGHATLAGTGRVETRVEARGDVRVEVIGVSDRAALGIDEALTLAERVLEIVGAGGEGPILVLIDSDSQRMSKRDELLGLNEYLAHLAKTLIHADAAGRPTVGLLYGHTAAGAFIATALATRVLVALPGAEPEVMDLASMAKVTKLSIDVLRDKARSTPVFAPGLDNLAQTGAVLATWDASRPLDAQLLALLDGERDRTDGGDRGDRRDRLGLARRGRPKAAEIADRVRDQALRAV